MNIVCEDCICLGKCLTRLRIEKANWYTFGYFVGINSLTNRCDKLEEQRRKEKYAKIKIFFLKKLGIFNESSM